MIRPLTLDERASALAFLDGTIDVLPDQRAYPQAERLAYALRRAEMLERFAAGSLDTFDIEIAEIERRYADGWAVETDVWNHLAAAAINDALAAAEWVPA